MFIGNPSVTKAFFDIPKEQIARDLAHAEENFERITQDIHALSGIPSGERTPELYAKRIHLQMVR